MNTATAHRPFAHRGWWIAPALLAALSVAAVGAAQPGGSDPAAHKDHKAHQKKPDAPAAEKGLEEQLKELSAKVADLDAALAQRSPAAPAGSGPAAKTAGGSMAGMGAPSAAAAGSMGSMPAAAGRAPAPGMAGMPAAAGQGGGMSGMMHDMGGMMQMMGGMMQNMGNMGGAAASPGGMAGGGGGMMDNMNMMGTGGRGGGGAGMAGGGGGGMAGGMMDDDMMGMGGGGGGGMAGGGGMMDDMGEMAGMMGMAPTAPMRNTAALPGFAGASHLYHIGADDFFLNHDQHVALSTEQRTGLTQAREQALLAKATADRQVAQAEQELWQLTAADQPDAAEVEAKVREIETFRGDGRLAFIRAVGEAAKLLTPEQIKQLLGQLPPAAQQPGPMAPGMGGAAGGAMPDM